MLGTVLFAALLAQFPAAIETVTQAPSPQQAPAAQQPPSTAADAERPWPPEGTYRPGPGVVSPRLIDETKPHYVADAMVARVHGVVKMEAVVETDGTVGEVRVTRSLDTVHGQDDECVRTVKKWRFKPGTKDGVPVPVVVEVEMTFTMDMSRR